MAVSAHKALSARQPILEILLRHRQRLLRCFWLWRVQFGVVGLVERHSVILDVHKEVTPVRETIVHFLQGVHDEVDRCLERTRDAVFAHQPVIELGPVFDPVGQPLVVDDDKQIVIRLIALRGMRFVDLGAARIAAIKDDLQNSSGLFPLMLCERKSVVELLEDQLHHALQLALFLWWEMVEIASHLFQPSKAGLDLHPVFASFLIERAATAPPPQGQCLFALFALKFGGDREKRTEQDRTVIIGQFDQPCLFHQSAQFDQLARSFASFHGPGSRVGAALAGFNAQYRCPGLSRRLDCCP